MSQHFRVRNEERSRHPMDRVTADETRSRSMPVLMVEDFSSMARILRNLLHQIGLENVDDAAGARIALEMMRKKHYELLITDCNMTGMSGYELLREIRTDPHLEMTPVLLMTADPSVITLIRETDLTQYLGPAEAH